MKEQTKMWVVSYRGCELKGLNYASALDAKETAERYGEEDIEMYYVEA